MSAIILVWIVVVVCEAYRHWYLIVMRKRSPNRVLSAILRILAAALVWGFAPIMYRGMMLDQWWAIPIMEVLVFWFLFDLLLNVTRGKKFYYLGDGKWIDRIQKQTIGEYPAFWFKLILAAASVTLCYEGLGAVLHYQG